MAYDGKLVLPLCLFLGVCVRPDLWSAHWFEVPLRSVYSPNVVWCVLMGFQGIAYGGTYGLIMAMVLEAVPRRARGVVAGFTQQGFAAGYLFASGLHLAMSMSYPPLQTKASD